VHRLQNAFWSLDKDFYRVFLFSYTPILHHKFFVTHAAFYWPLMKLIDHILHKNSLLLFWWFLGIQYLIWYNCVHRRGVRCCKLLWNHLRINETRDNATLEDARKPFRVVFSVHFIKLKALFLSWGDPWLAKRELVLLLLCQLSLLVHDCVVNRHNMRMDFRKGGVKISRELISFVIIRKIVTHYFLY
jgi:hypothetical protein